MMLKQTLDWNLVDVRFSYGGHRWDLHEQVCKCGKAEIFAGVGLKEMGKSAYTKDPVK